MVVPLVANVSGNDDYRRAVVSRGIPLQGTSAFGMLLDPFKSPHNEKPAAKNKLMLAAGIERLRKQNFIDDRLFDWSQQLQAFRNLAAHPENITISREDAEDLQTFV